MTQVFRNISEIVFKIFWLVQWLGKRFVTMSFNVAIFFQVSIKHKNSYILSIEIYLICIYWCILQQHQYCITFSSSIRILLCSNLFQFLRRLDQQKAIPLNLTMLWAVPQTAFTTAWNLLFYPSLRIHLLKRCGKRSFVLTI